MKAATPRSQAKQIWAAIDSVEMFTARVAWWIANIGKACPKCKKEHSVAAG